MRLICELKLNQSIQIDDIIYTKKHFTLEDFEYYNERYRYQSARGHSSWERYRDLLSSTRQNAPPRSDYWVKIIEMQYKGYVYQTVGSDYNRDIYEVIGIKENKNIERQEIDYYFRPSRCIFDYLPYVIILKIGYKLKKWSDIWVYTNSCQTTLLLRKDFKFALRARKVYIRERRDINVRDKKLPIYINGLYWQQRICLDDSYLLGGIPFNGQKQQEI